MPATLRRKDLLTIAFSIGLVGGVIEILILGALKAGLGKALWLGHHTVWMAPMMAAIFGLVLGGFPALVLRRRFPRAALGVAIFTSTLVATWSALILLPRFHEKALLLVAAGVAVQATRYGLRHPERISRQAAWSLLVLMVIVTSLGTGFQVRRLWAERTAIARLPAPPEKAPNVLLVVLDTQRAPSMSLHGYHRPTSPNLERFARRGVVFDRAVSVSSWTLPAHGTMFTGYYPHQLSAAWKRPLDATYPTLAETLAGRGYLTAGFVANTFYCQSEYGLNRGFQRYEDYVASVEELLVTSSLGRRLTSSRPFRRLIGYYDIIARRRARDINRQFLRWLDRAPERPFFAFLNYFDTHAIYLPPAPFDDWYGTKENRAFSRLWYKHRLSDLTPKQHQLPRAALQAELDAYDGAVAYVDHQLELLFQELERRQILDNTLVIITSDHGEQFGEHDLFYHGNSLFMQSLHIPLILRLPGAVPEGLRVQEPVSLRDLPATVLDLAGVGEDSPLPGMSLARYWEEGEGATPPSPVFSSMVANDTATHSVVVGRYHYIRKGTRPLEFLYDWEADPAEEHDLLRSGEGRGMLPALRAEVDSMLADSIPTAPGRMGVRGTREGRAMRREPT